MNAIAEPKLAPPGAGLPKAELFVARLRFYLRRALGSRASFNRAFQAERGQIRALTSTLSPELAAKRVLIERVAGLEVGRVGHEAPDHVPMMR